MNMSLISNIVNVNEFEVITLDVFDTLLLRNYKPEIYRFLEIAKLQSVLLSEKYNLRIPAQELFVARQYGINIAYQTSPINENERDATLSHIYLLMLKCFGKELKTDIYTDLLNVELDYEIQNLKANRNLINELKMLKEKYGFQLGFISDMYLSGDSILFLLNSITPDLNLDFYYSSSDHSLTKNGGGLYRYVMKSENLDKNKTLHIGDNYISDYVKANENGIRAIHVPRDKFYKGNLKMYEKIFRLFFNKYIITV